MCCGQGSQVTQVKVVKHKCDKHTYCHRVDVELSHNLENLLQVMLGAVCYGSIHSQLELLALLHQLLTRFHQTHAMPSKKCIAPPLMQP